MVRSRFVLVLLAAAAAPAFAQDDTPSLGKLALDKGFGKGGSVKSISAGDEVVNDLRQIAVDAAGRIVIVGITLVRGHPRYGTDEYAVRVARFLPDGTLDPAFGGDGVVTLPVESRFINGMAIDSLGGITVTGFFHDPGKTFDTGTRLVGARLRGDGTLDTGFSGDGLIAATELLGDDADVGAVRATPAGGAIVLTSYDYIYETQRQRLQLFRLLSDGSRDPSFGENGQVDLGEVTGDFAPDAEGGVVFARHGLYGDLPEESRIVRILPDGTEDPAFGTLGVLRGGGSEIVRGDQVEIDRLGRIVVVGREGHDVRAIYRYTKDGQADVTFPGAGRAALPMGVPGNSLILRTPPLVLARDADRYALMTYFWFTKPNLGHPIADGWFVQGFDASVPGAVNSFVKRVARRVFPQVSMAGAAISPDGTAAYAIGATEVDRTHWTPIFVKVALTNPAPLPVPNIAVEWAQQPVFAAIDHEAVTGTLRVFSTEKVAVANAGVGIWASVDEHLDGADLLVYSTATGPIRGNGQKFLKLVKARIETNVDLVGRHLIAVVNPLGELSEVTRGDNETASEPLAAPVAEPLPEPLPGR